MDPRTNPYAPGADTLPPELAGRDDIIELVDIQLDRCRKGTESDSIRRKLQQFYKNLSEDT